MNININNSVCAVIVVFYPDISYEDSIESLLTQVEKLVIVDNSENGVVSKGLIKQRKQNANIIIIQNFSNMGIAKALNQAIDVARQFNCCWLLTLDQDTHYYKDIVEQLLSIYRVAEESIKVVGGNYYDTHNDLLYWEKDKSCQYKEVKTVITAGCLINVQTAIKIGCFREDFFIDQVDHEYCLRVRDHGYKVVLSNIPVMDHCVGEKGGVTFPMLGTFPNHSPLRKYYISRNSIVTIMNYWNKEPLWCITRFIKLMMGLFLILLFEKQKMLKTKAFITGFIDALRNRSGECQYHWLI